MTIKTPFDALVDLRRHEEDEARARAVAARAAERAAAEEHERRQRALERGLDEARVRAELWASFEHARARLQAEVAQAEKALREAQGKSQAASAAEREATRKRHVAEMLADKSRAEQREVAARKERRTFDELAGVRHVLQRTE